MIEDLKGYVEKLKSTNPILKAEKTGCVVARIGQEGEHIDTYVSNGTLETSDVVKRDPDGNLGIVVTMADLSGNKIIDTFGRTNTYITKRDTFNKKYKDAAEVTENEQFFKPTGGVQEFVQINEDIEITAPWGEVQNLKKGSFLNVTNEKDIYGIAYEEFMKTYGFVNTKDAELAFKPNELKNNIVADDITK